ncbi:MAG TPA: serine/threonine-protein kinase [Herpetosiphonaceae bacterium]
MNLLRPDKLLQQRYRVVQLIERGGFGAVYEAIDIRINRRVALKQLTRITELIRRQFEREAQLLANLNHPALPRVTDYFNDLSGQFLVMDYIPGDDLGIMLDQQGAPFPVDQVLRWGDQLLDVLHYLHSYQPPIIHRDLKPQNLKLKADGSIILLDFGLAKGYAGEIQSSSTASSLMAFTRGFAPPEQVEGTGTDARSDLYGLGATLYCLLTNEPLPDAQTRLLRLAKKQTDSIIPVHELNPLVPVDVSRVLHMAMALEKDERPANAQAMRSMLHAAYPALPTQTATPPVTVLATPTEIATEIAAPDVGPPVIWIDRQRAGVGNRPSSARPVRPSISPVYGTTDLPDQAPRPKVSRIAATTQMATEIVLRTVEAMNNVQLAAVSLACIVTLSILTYLVGETIRTTMPGVWIFFNAFPYIAAPLVYTLSRRRIAILIVHIPVYLLVNLLYSRSTLLALCVSAVLSGLTLWFLIEAIKQPRWLRFVLSVTLAYIVGMLNGLVITNPFPALFSVFGAALIGLLNYVIDEMYQGVQRARLTNKAYLEA